MVQIRNGVGIGSIQFFTGDQTEGQIHGDGRDIPYENPLLPQVSSVTYTASADVSDEIVENQVFTVTLTDPDGVPFVSTYTVDAADDTAGTDADGLGLMAQRMSEAIEANADLVNVVAATFTTAGVLTITWLHPDQGVWTVVSAIAPAAAEQTLLTADATSQTAGGVAVPMARFLASRTPVGGVKRQAGLPTSGGDTIVGVSIRDITQSRGTSTLLAATNDYPAGTVMSVREVGSISMVNVGSAAANDHDAVHAVVNIAAGTLGQARVDRSGVAQVTTATPTVANTTTYQLTVDIPAQDGFPALNRPFTIVSDGTATDVEICDALKALMAADAAFTARITTDAAGGTTIVFTGVDPGLAFTVTDTQDGVGDWTSIVETTAAEQHTILVPSARWTESTAANGVGKVYVNL